MYLFASLVSLNVTVFPTRYICVACESAGISGYEMNSGPFGLSGHQTQVSVTCNVYHHHDLRFEMNQKPEFGHQPKRAL